MTQPMLTEIDHVAIAVEDLPAAIDLLQKAVAVNPAAPEPHYFLAGIYMAQGRQEEFRKEKEAFLRLGGGSAADSLHPLPGGGSP